MKPAAGPRVVDSPVTLLEGPAGHRPDYGRLRGSQNNTGNVDELHVRLFRLRATSPAAHPTLAEYKSAGASPRKALKGKRDVYWKDGFIPTNIYEQSRLECGNVIAGPAIIESEDTTILVPAGKKYTVDRLLNGVIEKA